MSQQEYTNWLPEEEYNKFLSKWRMSAGALLHNLFHFYGQQTEIDIAMKGLEELTEKFGMALRGKQVPIQLPDWLQRRIEEEGPDD